MIEIKITRKPNSKKKNSKIGFTNSYAIALLLFLLLGLIGGLYLAVCSIRYNYLGSLLCWTVVFTPIGTSIGIVLGKIVDKSRAENTAGGVKYEQAMSEIRQEESNNSPPI